jgi:hypothetical protein
VTGTAFDERLARVEAGEALTPADIQELAVSPDIVSLGMLADTRRRRLRGPKTTYVRVATCAFDGVFTDAVLPAAREPLRAASTPALWPIGGAATCATSRAAWW